MSSTHTTPPAGPLAGFARRRIRRHRAGPFAGMMFADMGADVVVVDRAADVRPGNKAMALQRGKRSLALDLKHPDALAAVWRLLEPPTR